MARRDPSMAWPCWPICVTTPSRPRPAAFSALHRSNGQAFLAINMFAMLHGGDRRNGMDVIGVLTTTASSDFSCSSILRKSRYRLAPGYLANEWAALLSSTSHKATMFSLVSPEMFSVARPPAPINPMLSFSFGEMRRARAWEPTCAHPPGRDQRENGAAFNKTSTIN